VKEEETKKMKSNRKQEVEDPEEKSRKRAKRR
jgi:hypothetical protein